MLISTGRVPSSASWRILEVAVGQVPDVLALRFSRELKHLRDPVEVLLPFTPNASGAPEWIVEHVYIRGGNIAFRKLSHVAGIDFTRPETASPDWIARLVECEQRCENVPRLNDFVRVLRGPCSQMCGRITRIDGSLACVSISLPTKTLRTWATFRDVQPIECAPLRKHSLFF